MWNRPELDVGRFLDPWISNPDLKCIVYYQNPEEE